MQTIETRYYGPTNHKGSRIRVKTSGGYVRWFSWNSGIGATDNHMVAAKAVKDELDWPGKCMEAILKKVWCLFGMMIIQ